MCPSFLEQGITCHIRPSPQQKRPSTPGKYNLWKLRNEFCTRLDTYSTSSFYCTILPLSLHLKWWWSKRLLYFRTPRSSELQQYKWNNNKLDYSFLLQEQVLFVLISSSLFHYPILTPSITSSFIRFNLRLFTTTQGQTTGSYLGQQPETDGL